MAPREMPAPRMLVTQGTQSLALLECQTLVRLPAQSLQGTIFTSGHAHALNKHPRQEAGLSFCAPFTEHPLFNDTLTQMLSDSFSEQLHKAAPGVAGAPNPGAMLLDCPKPPKPCAGADCAAPCPNPVGAPKLPKGIPAAADALGLCPKGGVAAEDALALCPKPPKPDNAGDEPKVAESPVLLAGAEAAGA